MFGICLRRILVYCVIERSNLFILNAQKELDVTWDVDLYGELLKIGGGKER